MTQPTRRQKDVIRHEMWPDFPMDAACSAAAAVLSRNPKMAFIYGRDEPDSVMALALEVGMAFVGPTGFDPTKAKFSTWATMVATSRLRDRYKSAMSTKARTFVPMPRDNKGREIEFADDRGVPLTLEHPQDFMERVSASINRARGSRGGPNGHPTIAMVRALAIRHQQRIGWRKLERMLRDGDLARQLGFNRPPCLNALQQFQRRLIAALPYLRKLGRE
jgi:hypothetical protein